MRFNRIRRTTISVFWQLLYGESLDFSSNSLHLLQVCISFVTGAFAFCVMGGKWLLMKLIRTLHKPPLWRNNHKHIKHSASNILTHIRCILEDNNQFQQHRKCIQLLNWHCWLKFASTPATQSHDVASDSQLVFCWTELMTPNGPQVSVLVLFLCLKNK